MAKEIDLQQLKKLQLQIMDVVDKFCRDNDIRYFITAGTLIGALRHKGFIPWDDDIDIVMLRDDYIKFISGFKDFSQRYKVFSNETDKRCHYAYAKVYDDTTVFVEGHEDIDERIGVNIDIFPLDYATDNYADALRLKKKIKVLDDVVTVKHISTKNRGFKKNVCLGFLKALCAFIPYYWCIRKIDKIARKYENQTTSRYVVNAVIYAKGEREILEREWFEACVELPFEGRKYFAPVGADQYMRRLFGDYMKLPPEEKRVSHHVFMAYYK